MCWSFRLILICLWLYLFTVKFNFTFMQGGIAQQNKVRYVCIRTLPCQENAYIFIGFSNKSYRYFLPSDVPFCSKIYQIAFGGRTHRESSAHSPSAFMHEKCRTVNSIHFMRWLIEGSRCRERPGLPDTSDPRHCVPKTYTSHLGSSAKVSYDTSVIRTLRPTVWVEKKSPLIFLWHFSQNLGIFSTNFTCLLYVPIYAGLQIFIQSPATLTQLRHIKRDQHYMLKMSTIGWNARWGYIGIYSLPKSGQVNFLWSSNEVRTVIELFPQ